MSHNENHYAKMRVEHLIDNMRFEETVTRDCKECAFESSNTFNFWVLESQPLLPHFMYYLGNNSLYMW